MSDYEEEEVLDLILEEEEEVLAALMDTSQEPNTSRKRSTARRKLSAPLQTCHLCAKKYESLNGYTNHLKIHIWEDLCKTAPSLMVVESAARLQTMDILKSIPPQKAQAGISQSVRDLSKLLQNCLQDFYKFVDGLTAALWSFIPPPTSGGLNEYHARYTTKCHNFLCDSTERSEMMKCLKDIVKEDVPSIVMEWFITDLVRKFAEFVETFHLKSLREPRQLLHTEVPHHRNDPDNARFQQTVYYIGGSNVRSVMRVGLQSTTSEMWKRILTCIEMKLLASENAQAPTCEVSAWATSLDRGGLLHISDNLWKFLLALSGVCNSKEEKDGSLKHEIILEAVSNDDVLVMLWDEVVQGSIPHEESSVLRQYICKFFVNTWGAGIAMRRKNANADLCRDKIAFRPSML